MNDKKSVLVTGATGLLGTFVLRSLIKKFEVSALVRSYPESPFLGVKYVIADLESAIDISLLPSKLDVIIHLAQTPKFREFPETARDIFSVNVSSTAQLLDYAKSANVKHFIYASSGGVYGAGSHAFKENSAISSLGQLGYYLGSKACGEILVQSYVSLFQVTIIRPFFIYGPGQNRGMLMPRLMDSVESGTPISLHGSDGIRVNPIHVEDACAAVLGVLGQKVSATYNIAGPDILSIRQIAEAMGDYFGNKPIFQQAEGEPKDLIADIAVMKSKLYSPRRSLFAHLQELRR